MNSRERVLAIYHDEIPDRVPIWCGASVEFWEKAKRELGLDDEGLRLRFRDDFRRIFTEYTGPEFPFQHPEATSRTVFGVERAGLGYGQPLDHPLAEATLQQVHDYPWPEPDWIGVSTLRSQAEIYDNQYAILGGDWSPFWHDAIDLLGMENLCMKMCTEPDVVEAMLGHMVDYYFEVNKRIFEEAADVIDIFFMGNDYGSQHGPLISPKMFDQFMAPHQKRLCELGHSYGLKTQLHCCGGIRELIPSMIATGVNGLHAIQPSCKGMELELLKASFGGKIVFNGAIDSHHILIEKDAVAVREETRKVLDIMKPGGGYIAGASHDTILEETPVANILAMVDAIEEHGIYS